MRNEEEWAACWAVALAEKDRELEVCGCVGARARLRVCVYTLTQVCVYTHTLDSRTNTRWYDKDTAGEALPPKPYTLNPKPG